MVLLVVGKTCSGKDTVAHFIENNYNFKRIITYTTRPMRPDDVQGVSHHFVSKDEMSGYSKADMFSPTKIAGHDYFMLREQFSKEDAVCIVDPKGVHDFARLGVEHYAIYVESPESLILERAKERGTDSEVVQTRLDAERDTFDSFRDSCAYEYRINNLSTVDELKAKTALCMAYFGYQLLEPKAE